MKRALILGAGGFIGGHMMKRLKDEGFWVAGVDLRAPKHFQGLADQFVQGDLRDPSVMANAVDQDYDEIYQFAADMGGAGYIFTGEHDADVMHNSALINLNLLTELQRRSAGVVFYSSSACIYPKENQTDPDNPNCEEASAYPANPDSEYGWEKLFSERLYAAFQRNHGINAKVARYHNIFGPQGTWRGGREKAPAAMCRKAAEAAAGGEFEVWGDGAQTRSFLYVDDCIEATLRLTRSDHAGPLNIGSEEMVAINELAQLAIDISGKDIAIRNVPGPEGVRGRNSDNRLISAAIDWAPQISLREGMERTYRWIEAQLNA